MCAEFVWVYVCVCIVGVCFSMRLCVCAHICRPEKDIGHLLYSFLFSCLETVLSLNQKPEAHHFWLGWLASKPLGTTVSVLLYWEYRYLWLCSAFTWVLEGLSSSPHACRTNTLLVEPSPEAPYLIFGWTTSFVKSELLGNIAQTWSCQDWPVPSDCLCLTRLSLTFMNLMNKQFIGP